MGLRKYRDKRDFRRTPEPRGGARTERAPAKKKRARAPKFVIQKHAASRLHYDFRLEHDGVLKSWAIPKGPSFDPADKRLAVMVEDHPLEYGTFEGTIPEGEYGGGTVLLWDRGHWYPDVDVDDGLKRGRLKFHLEGEKLGGGWNLVRLGGLDSSGKENWLLIKERDEWAQSGAKKKPITDARPESVKTGRDLEAIATRSRKVWRSSRATEQATTRAAKSPARGATNTARTAKKPARATKRIVRAAKTAERAAQNTTRARTKSLRTGKQTARTKARSRAPDDPSGAPPTGAKRAALPGFVEPELATLVDAAPEGDEWFHEIKYDGYRMLARADRGRVRWFSRNGLDWTAKFEALSPSVLGLPAEKLLLDGEVVVVRKDGTTSFYDLQQALSEGAGERLTYYVFDLLHQDEWNLRGCTLAVRKERLRGLFGRSGAHGVVRYSDHIVGSGASCYSAACRSSLEGILSKKSGEPYRSGRTRDWLKVKCGNEQEFVVAGFTRPSGSRIGFGALVLGVRDGDRLRHVGRVGTGFDHQLLRSLRRRLGAMKIDAPPFDEPISTAAKRGVTWVAPKTVVQVGFTGWTRDGMLRHPTFQGLREDKPAREVRREIPLRRAIGASQRKVEPRERAIRSTRRPALAARSTRARAASGSSDETRPRSKARRPTARTRATPEREASPVPERGAKAVRRARASESKPVVAGVPISNPDRELYPDQGITKLELASFYERIAPRLLPHVASRPLSIVRCPQGATSPCFFQKHGHDTFPEHVKSVPVPEKSGTARYLMVDSVAGLVSLVQMGALELHPWGSRAQSLEHPDRMFFDLDPAPDVRWQRVADAALLLREILAHLGLVSFLKTTGGKGLHVVVPLAAKHGWDEVKEFSRVIAVQMTESDPKSFLATMSKAARRGKIFVDYLRNGRGSTAVAAYSTRAKPGAPVSTPIAWEELDRDVRSDTFGVRNLEQRFRGRFKDPWADFARTKQTLSAKAKRALGL